MMMMMMMIHITVIFMVKLISIQKITLGLHARWMSQTSGIPCGRKALLVQRGLPYGDFGFIPMLKTESGNFLIMTQQNTRL
jgi:hypothetical protein